MAAGATFQIGYPTTVTAPTNFIICTVTYNSVAYNMICTTIASNRVMYVKSGLTVPIPAGASVTVHVS